MQQRPSSIAAAEAERSGESLREIFAREDFLRGAGGGDAAFAQQQRVREGGDDLLHVMRDEEQGGGIFPSDLARGEALEEGEEVFARDGVEAGAGFVEDEHLSLIHI